MVWTTPRTWVDGEVVTAAGMMNVYLRDNLRILKTGRTNIGKVTGLTSDYVDDLDGTALDGLARLDADNSFTAHRSRFGGTATLRAPVGADAWAEDGDGPRAGSVWVEGQHLHHIDESRNEWRYLGDVIDAGAGAVPGYLFIVTRGLRYTDEDGAIRECVSSATTPQHSDTRALGGSLWIQGGRVHIVKQQGKKAFSMHSDVAHADHADHHDHTDHGDAGALHDDVAHSDSTPPHGDHHDGPGHVDHGDHGDVAHTDHADHVDHTDHFDTAPHGDAPPDSRPEAV